LETRIGILGVMMTRTGLALSLLLTCAALACSSAKSTGDTKEDGGPRPDSSAALETGRFGQDVVGGDRQEADALKPDGMASDGASQDAPAGQVPDGQGPDRTVDGSAAEAGAPGLDAVSNLDGMDDGARALDARLTTDIPGSADAFKADGPDASPATDGSMDAVEVASDGGPDAPLNVEPLQCGRIKCDCTYKGKKLWGKVEYVTSFPDFKVKVSSFPDLNVQETSFASRCGQWERVTSFGDFKVQIVDTFEDFDIAYSSFPGIP
jgi:hypothetical protein